MNQSLNQQPAPIAETKLITEYVQWYSVKNFLNENENEEKKYIWTIFSIDNQIKSDKIVKYVNDALIDLRNDVGRKKFLRMKIQ